VEIGYLDIAIAIVLLLGVVRGGMIGLVRQTTNVAGLVVTIILAVALTRPVGQIIEANTGWPHEAALVTSFLAIFLVVKLATVLIAKSADGAVDALKLSSVNRVGGGLFGAFKAALLLSGVFVVLDLADIPEPDDRKVSIAYETVSGILPRTWDYMAGKAPILDEYRQKIEDGAREGVETIGAEAASKAASSGN
jgi:membrane protein required for colicin V production